MSREPQQQIIPEIAAHIRQANVPEDATHFRVQFDNGKLSTLMPLHLWPEYSACMTEDEHFIFYKEFK
jgi:hypothetical protein